MAYTRTLALFLAVALAAAAASPPRSVRARRQLADDNSLQPIEDADGDEQAREKRKLEGATQAKFGIKNAVLGFVFGDGTTYRRHIRVPRDSSPARVSLLPTKATTSLKQNTSSLPQGISGMTKGGDLAPSLTRASNSRTPDRGARQTDDIPVFDRNKVSLDFPGSLFGPSLSLLIRTTKIIGDVIQNSAVRYQSFLRLFRPLFRGPFEIKGLDPPTTTTTTTTTTTAAPATADNEVRKR